MSIASSSGAGEQAYNDTLEWTLGLIASNGSYLTAEAFGNRINADGKNLRKKQIFTLEQEGEDAHVYIRSNLGKYLTAGKQGELTCDGESRGADQKWKVTAHADGRWSFQSVHGYYFSGTGDKLHAFARDIGETEKWTIHLAMHPQVAIRNVNRRRYVHLANGELQVNEDIPWGDDAMLTVEFHSGRYSFRASNNKFLSKGGKLVDAVNDDCLYIIEFFESKVAFKANDGKYLQGYGSQGVLCARRNTVGKDELFELEDSHPQVTLASSSGRFVSVKQTSETKADQQEVEDSEVFQMEFKDGKWCFRTHKNVYWTVTGNGNIDAVGQVRDAEFFTVEWMGPEVALKASNGKYVTAKLSGQLCASSASVGDKEKFVLNLINRPQLILRSQFGFCAAKGGKNKVMCNSVEPEVYQMVAKDGRYTIQGPNGKFWHVDADGTVSPSGSAPEEFSIELREHSRLALKAPNGCYFKGEQMGAFTANASALDDTCLWEF